MPKILFVLETTIIGGIERLALNLLKALPATYEKHVIITEKEGLFTDSFKASSNTYQFLKGYTPDASSTVSQLRDIIKTGKFDIVHVFNGIQNLMAIPRGVRCVFTAGGDYNREVYWERAKFFGYTKDKILSEMSGLNITIFTDKDTNKYVFPNNVKISRNIISFKSYSDTPKDPKKVIWVGRNSFEKRPDILQNIAKCMPEYTFIQCLAEEGSTHPENKINNVIVYYNVLDDEWMQTLYAESSICLNTSDTEGIPLSILEAHSQGCHVIGRNATKGINDTTVSNPRTDEFVKVIRSCPIESDDTRRERGKKVID
jgi:glycosyltransferase involved in cell wall biosynthesis